VNQGPFSLAGRVAVVTGGGGVLGGTLASGLAEAGVRVAVLDLRRDTADRRVDAIRDVGGTAMAVTADVLAHEQVAAARDAVVGVWERVDILINAAGGNVDRARSDDRSVFEVPQDAFDQVVRLNLHGTVIPSLVFGETMARQRAGCIVNISSMAARQVVSGVLGYSVAKAGVDNLTRWLAVDFARKYGDRVRVNAIAPGFFVTTQNRDVLLNPDGSHTARSHTILHRTPMGRFGEPEELIGAVRWLCSDAASFVTGVVIPIDGGFTAFSGV
jgi:NAD(P)-dependent dehydrogenase (short-subunit alcohol dehydrogenase family)